MTDPNRYKRPDLERSQPVRSFRGVFGPPTSAPTPAAPSGVDGPAAPHGSGPRQPGVPLGVDLGYRVIEEYMQQGQAFARAVFPSGAPAGLPDPRKLNERIFKYASDLAAAWLEYVQTLSGSGAMGWPTPGTPDTPTAAAHGGNAFDTARRAPTGQLGPFDMPGPTNGHASTPANGHAKPPPPTAPAADAPAREAAAHGDAREAAYPPFALAIDLASKKRAEVTLDLKPGAPTALSAHELRAADPNLPRIGPVVIEMQPDQQRVVVRICVPDTQPAAIYNALILDDATNLPRGTLTVRITD